MYPSAPSVPVPAQTAVKVQDVDRSVILSDLARARADARKNHTLTWQRVIMNLGLWSNAAGLPNDILLTGYTVPEQTVLEITSIGLQWSDPYVGASGLVDCYLMVNGSRLPNWTENGAFWSAFAADSFWNPQPIEPIFVQAGETVELYAVRTDVAFVGFASVAARLLGNLRNLAGGQI